MGKERFEKLRAIYEIKTANGLDVTVKLWNIMQEIVKEVPDITLEELRRLGLHHYCESYKRLPGVDDFTYLLAMLADLKDLINDFESIVDLDVSEQWRMERLSDAEVKLGTLIGYFPKAIQDYVGDSYQTEFVDDETLTKLVSNYMEALKKEDINDLNVFKYYCNIMIPFYKSYYNIVLEALKQSNKALLLQVAEWTIALVFRCIFMIYRLSKY